MYKTIYLFAGIGDIRLDVQYYSKWYCVLHADSSYNYYLFVNGIRRLTAREMLRLQGFPDSFKINLLYSAVHNVAGNIFKP